MTRIQIILAKATLAAIIAAALVITILGVGGQLRPCDCSQSVTAAIDSVRTSVPYRGDEIGIVTIKGVTFLVFSNGNGIKLQELEVAP